METKTIILSSAGLRNVNIGACSEDNIFSFQIGPKEIQMNSFYADFISPTVANHHRADPTLNYLSFDEFYDKGYKEFQNFANEIVTEEIASLLQQLASGASIDVNRDQAFKLRFFSIIIGNEELYQKINEVFPSDFDDGNLELYVQNALCCYYFSQICPDFNFNEVVDFLAENFYAIDKEKLLDLPRSIIYKIISNSHLKLESEDSFLDFIIRVFQTESEESQKSDISIIDFYEKVDFYGLSENRLLEFLDGFDLNDMTTSLWIKFYQGLIEKSSSYVKPQKNRYKLNEIMCNYDSKSPNSLNGIISYLTKECGGNVHDKKVVEVTASSTLNGDSDFLPKYAVDFDSNRYFASNNTKNSWLKYDFKDKKIIPTYYTIKTRSANQIYNPSNWVIEVSNNNNDWKTIDNQNGGPFLNNNATQSYKIKKNLNQNEGFRYIRFKQLNNNNGGSFNLYISGLEFFGKIIS